MPKPKKCSSYSQVQTDRHMVHVHLYGWMLHANGMCTRRTPSQPLLQAVTRP